jgi:hypothetical protein
VLGGVYTIEAETGIPFCSLECTVYKQIERIALALAHMVMFYPAAI